MIMIKSLSILLAAGMLGGCVALPEAFGACANPQGITPINISYQQQNNMVKVQVAPHKADADRGDLIRFKVNGSLGNTVTVNGKAADPDASWITGSATSGYFYVCVTMDKVVGQTYHYEVHVDGIGFLDPEVTVRR
jgi:hypothetical protein